MILHLLRMRRNVKRNVFNDRKKCKCDSVRSRAARSLRRRGCDLIKGDKAKVLLRFPNYLYNNFVVSA